MRKHIFIGIVSFCLGLVGGMLVFSHLDGVPLLYDDPRLTAFGIRKPQIIGFLPYWLINKATGPYWDTLTTLTYFGLTLDRDGSIVRQVNAQEEEPGWTTLQSQKVTNLLQEAKRKNIKTSFLVISGDDDVISDVLQNPVVSGKTLVADVGPLMKDRGMTDLNLDVETFMEASASSRAAFTLFVQTIKNEMIKYGLGSLTIDLIPIALVQEKLYDAAALGAIADYVVFMTYDYHYFGSYISGAVAPLGGAGETIEFDVAMAISEARKVIPARKILLGIPLYGYEWETIRGNPGAATIPGGSSTASSRRITEMLNGCATCAARFDEVAQQPFFIFPEADYFHQIYYENTASLQKKLEFAQNQQLGGVALWALGYEDDALLAPLSSYKRTVIIE